MNSVKFVSKDENKFVVLWKGDYYDCEWFDDICFDVLENVKQASGFIFNENNEMCLVKISGKDSWALPGGRPEDFDSCFEDTFVREVLEEADLKIKDILPVGYVKCVPRKNPESFFYQLRYIAKVEAVQEQTIDPATGKITERMFIKPEDFQKYSNWGESGIIQLEKALKKIGFD